MSRVLRATIQAENESLLFDDIDDKAQKDHSVFTSVEDSKASEMA